MNDINVVLVEDDFYSLRWMELLLRRDWRTRVVGDANDMTQLQKLLQKLQQHKIKVDLILFDAENNNNASWLVNSIGDFKKINKGVKILFTGVHPNTQTVRSIVDNGYSGYILKGEIQFSIAWAISLATENYFIVTPSINYISTKLPNKTIILDGQKPLSSFSQRDIEAARLAFIFSMERRELADELLISEEYSYGLVSALYEKIGLNSVLRGEIAPESYFGDHPALKKHINRIFQLLHKQSNDKSKSNKSHKAIDKETLAFHLITMPQIEIAND